jgi:hypothetical protein
MEAQDINKCCSRDNQKKLDIVEHFQGLGIFETEHFCGYT